MNRDNEYKKYTVYRKTWVTKTEEAREIETIKYTHLCIVGEAPPPGIPPEPFDIKNVMGQEDLYREEQDGPIRVLNYATARIVFTTTVPTIARVLYSPGDLDLDLDTGILNPTEPQKYYEIFLPDQSVDTLYAFRVIATEAELDENDNVVLGETKESLIYYYQIGGIVTQDLSSLLAEPILEMITVETLVIETMPAIIEVLLPDNVSEGLVFANLTIDSISFGSRDVMVEYDTSNLFTSYFLDIPPI